MGGDAVRDRVGDVLTRSFLASQKRRFGLGGVVETTEEGFPHFSLRRN